MPPKRRRYGTRSQSQSQSQQNSQPDSLASLPPNRGASIAVTGPVTAEHVAWGTTEALAAIADCNHVERDLEQLVPIPRQRFGEPRTEKGKAKEGNYWRTAMLSFACTCNLPRYPKAWVSNPPKLSLGSGRLEIPEWSTDVCEEIDPEANDLSDFEELWRAPPPLPAAPPPPAVLPAHSRILSRLSSPSAASGAERSSSLPAATQRAEPNLSARRHWWRATIEADRRYGLIDQVLKAEYATPFVPSVPRTEDEWKLPKRLGQQRHPFHPDVHHYLRRSGTRVHWVIPVHGPVIIPGWGDPVAGSRTPFTSRGEMDETQPSAGGGEKARPLLWTPELLKGFVAALVELQHEGRYGRLRIAPSGPKPDPFLATGRGSVPASHSHVPKKKRPKSDDSVLFTPDDVPPVGVECGDHVRVYVDAHKALSFRTWLNHWDEGRFAKCRFALVAPTGECLIVA